MEAMGSYAQSAEWNEVFNNEHVRLQEILTELHAGDSVPIVNIKGVGKLILTPEFIRKLLTTFIVEILGMPRAGKSTMIKRYKQELLQMGISNVAFAEEGARSIESTFGSLRQKDPFIYTLMGAIKTHRGLMNILAAGRPNMIIMDRGLTDIRVFRRMRFLEGYVHPDIMLQEAQYMHDIEIPPMNIGGIIMMMITPEEAINRNGGQETAIVNRQHLPNLYNQYWRLHHEITQGQVEYGLYTCIDAGKGADEVYNDFRTVMNIMLNLAN